MLQEPASWRVFVWLAVIGFLLAGAAIAARSSRPLIWTAILLCGEELIALQVGGRPAAGWALAFAMLLFAGLESAYWAGAEDYAPQSVAIYARSLLPVFSAAAGAAIFLALVARASAISGLGLVLTGLGGATAIVVVLALLALRTRRQ